MRKAIFFVLSVIVIIENANGTSPPKPLLPLPKSSTCLYYESISNLNMQKMLGTWRVIEVSTTIAIEQRQNVKPIKCQSFEIKEDNDKYALTHTLDTTFINNKKLVQENRPLRNSTDSTVTEILFAVIDTDYDNYAVVIICEQHFTHHREAYILSRISSLNSAIKESVHKKLQSSNFEVVNMELVDQDNC